MLNHRHLRTVNLSSAPARRTVGNLAVGTRRFGLATPRVDASATVPVAQRSSAVTSRACERSVSGAESGINRPLKVRSHQHCADLVSEHMSSKASSHHQLVSHNFSSTRRCFNYCSYVVWYIVNICVCQMSINTLWLTYLLTCIQWLRLIHLFTFVFLLTIITMLIACTFLKRNNWIKT